MKAEHESTQHRSLGNLAYLLGGIALFVLSVKLMLLRIEHDWPQWLGVPLTGGFLFGMSLGLIGLHRVFRLGGWVVEAGHSFDRFAFSLAAVLFAFMAILSGVAALGFPVVKFAFGLIGMGSIYLAWKTPWWFWKSPSMEPFRWILRDTGTRLLYLVLGIFFCWAALFAEVAMVSR